MRARRWLLGTLILSAAGVLVAFARRPSESAQTVTVEQPREQPPPRLADPPVIPAAPLDGAAAGAGPAAPAAKRALGGDPAWLPRCLDAVHRDGKCCASRQCLLCVFGKPRPAECPAGFRYYHSECLCLTNLYRTDCPHDIACNF